MFKKPVLLLVTIVMIFSMLLASCTTPTATATQAPADTQAPVATAVPTAVPDTKFTIGISNPFISSEYRTQMIAELVEVNKEYMDQVSPMNW